jgi:hypothetical protein
LAFARAAPPTRARNATVWRRDLENAERRLDAERRRVEAKRRRVDRDWY